MRADELDHKELLELDPDGGLIRFAGQRALLLDAVAMGLLRKYLVENFGLTATRTVLTQFGFAHGWRMAEAMQTTFKWDSDDDWQRAGTRIHTLGGLFRVESGGRGPLSKEGVMLLASYEAEQHLLHFGRADEPVCWTICGLTSGYLSRSTGKEIYVLEDRCLGKGNAACHLLGRTRDEWGDEHAEELQFFEATRLKEGLDVSLHRVTETLKVAEKRLREHRRALVSAAHDPSEPLGIVAQSTAMHLMVDLARRENALGKNDLPTARLRAERHGDQSVLVGGVLVSGQPQPRVLHRVVPVAEHREDMPGGTGPLAAARGRPRRPVRW